MLQFFVVREGAEWSIKRDTRDLGSYPDQVTAIAAAVDLAEAEGKAGHAAQVLTKAAGASPEIKWTYGKDLYPTALGKPGNSRSRGSDRMP